MGQLVNAATSPFGVKLFKGSGYADGGALDRQQNQAAPMAAVGNSLIQQGSQLPGLEQMGMLQYLPQIFAQLSAMTGAQNPMTGQTQGVNRGAPGPLADGSQQGMDRNQYDQSPFALNPVQQSGLNQQNSQASQDMQRTMARIKANLSARGLTSSSHMDAAQRYYRNENMKRQNTNRAAAGYNAFQNRLDTTNQFGNMLSSIYGQQNQRQQGLLSQGQNLVSPQLQNTGQQAQMASANSANAQSGFGSLLGAGLGGMFGGAKGNPFVRPGQPGFDPGAGNPGGVGPPKPNLRDYTWNYR